MPNELDPLLQSSNVTEDVVIIQDEAIVIMSEAAMDEEDAAAEAEDRHLPSTGTVFPQNTGIFFTFSKFVIEIVMLISFTDRKRKRISRERTRKVPNQTQLQQAAELYNNSATLLATAVTQMSNSVSELATAINTFAEALNNSNR